MFKLEDASGDWGLNVKRAVLELERAGRVEFTLHTRGYLWAQSGEVGSPIATCEDRAELRKFFRACLKALEPTKRRRKKAKR